MLQADDGGGSDESYPQAAGGGSARGGARPAESDYQRYKREYAEATEELTDAVRREGKDSELVRVLAKRVIRMCGRPPLAARGRVRRTQYARSPTLTTARTNRPPPPPLP